MVDLTHFNRWIQLSVYKNIDEKRQGIPLYVVGQQRDTQTGVYRYIELRIDGPFYSLVGTSDEYKIDIDIDLVCTASLNEKDVTILSQLTGICMQALQEDFCVYRFGKMQGDDESYVGTMQTVSNVDTIIHSVGVLEAESNVQVAIVSAHFSMTL